MAYGLTLTGFVPKPYAVIVDEIADSLEEFFGPVVAGKIREGSGAIGKMAGVYAAREALMWELAEAAYGALDPDSSDGAQLAAIAALTGTIPRGPLPSTVTLTLTGDNATDVLAGSLSSVTGGGDKFKTLVDGTITTATSWAALTVYVVGDRRTNGGNVYLVTVGGQSAASGGPTTTDPAIVDGTVTWRFLGEGVGYVDVAAASAETGPVAAPSGTINEIFTSVSGWLGVINVLDATPGRNDETPEALRLRREIEISQAGSTPIDSIRADVLQIDDVTTCRVFNNPKDTVDADGMPPHSIEALVQGGADQDIFDEMLRIAGGVLSHGTEIGAATDSQGTSHVVKFSRPVELSIYVDIELIVDPDTYPADGDAQVQAAIVAYGDLQQPGKDAVASRIGAAAFAVAGVLDVVATLIDTSPSPATSATIPVSLRELAVYDTSRITVDSTTTATP